MDDHRDDHNGVTRRTALECMVWAGTGLLWTIAGGVPRTAGLIGDAMAEEGGFSFVQISDSHVGFDKPANPDARVTLREAIAQVRAAPVRPAFMLHTGDVSHLSKPKEFDDADQIIREAGLDVRYVPGEHDILDEDRGRAWLDRYGKGAQGAGWYSFDQAGVHFIGLVNVVDLKGGGLGFLGPEQMSWLEADLGGRSRSTPIVVFAHIPLWVVYPAWGWGTDDGARALELLKPFGSVTVLNGHIHQIVQKVEGDMVFHTARSTAFPQPAPGSAPSPGPMTVPADRLRTLLGLSTVTVVARPSASRRDRPRAGGGLTMEFLHRRAALGLLALAGGAVASGARARAPIVPAGVPLLPLCRAALTQPAGAAEGTAVRIDNFTFDPAVLAVKAGATVTWRNDDDIPHTVVSTTKVFRSKPLDTGDSFAFSFPEAGVFDYFCSLHPHMQGKIVVEP